MVKLCQATIFGWLNHYCWLNLDQSCWTESCPIHVLRIACPFKSTLMVSHGTITTRRWTWRAKKLVKIDHRTIGGFEHGLALSAGLDNLFLHGGGRSFVKIINTLPENSPWHRKKNSSSNPLVNRFYVQLAPPWFISFFSNGTDHQLFCLVFAA